MDVQVNFDVSKEEALDILYRALTNTATVEQIWLAIKVEAEERGHELQ